MILYLFLSHLGVGIFLSLLFVARDAGVKFFRFNAGMAAILIAVGIAFRPGDDTTPLAQLAFATLMVCGAAIVLYWATVGRVLASIRPAILAVGGLAGVVAIVAQAMAASADRGLAMQALTVTSFLRSVALLGGACTAMVLGHWYLVIPSLQVSHLQSMVKLHIVSMVLRVAVVGAAVFFAIATWEPGLGLPSFRHYIMSVERRVLLAARAVRTGGPRIAVVSHLGNGQDSLDPVGDGNPLRRLLYRRRRRGARQVPAARDARARVVD